MMTKEYFEFREFDAEMYLAKRLEEMGSQIFTGSTNHDTRREAFRCAIIDGGVENRVLGKRAGKEETVASFFERIFGEPLYRLKDAS